MRELHKEQQGDAIDKYFRLEKNLNQRDTIAVRKMVGEFIKLLYPDGAYTKEQLEEVLQLSLEIRRRVKEQLKKHGGMSFMMSISLILITKPLKNVMFLYRNKVAVS